MTKPSARMSATLSTAIGVLFEFFVADFLTVLGLSGQKLAIAAQGESHEVGTASTLSNPKWLLAFICFLIGQGVEAFSLSFASQADIAAVSNLTLVWSALFSAYYFDERFNFLPKHWYKSESHRNVATVDKDHSPGTQSNSSDSTAISAYGATALVNDQESSQESCKSSSFTCFTEYVIGWDLLNYCLLLAGSVMIVVTAPPQEDERKVTAKTLLEKWTSFPYCLYALLLLAGIVSIATFLIKTWRNNPHIDDRYYRINGLLIANLAALLSSVAVTLSKIFLTLLKKIINHEDLDDADYVVHSIAEQVNKHHSDTLTLVIYILLITVWLCILVSSIYLLNLGLSRYEQRLIVPIYEITGTIFTIISGILFYKTYYDFSVFTAIVFIFGVVLMCLGIYLVSLREGNGSHTKQKTAKQTENNIDFEHDVNSSLLKNQIV